MRFCSKLEELFADNILQDTALEYKKGFFRRVCSQGYFPLPCHTIWSNDGVSNRRTRKLLMNFSDPGNPIDSDYLSIDDLFQIIGSTNFKETERHWLDNNWVHINWSPYTNFPISMRFNRLIWSSRTCYVLELLFQALIKLI